MGVMLYVNNRPMEPAGSVEEAKKKAELFIMGRPEVCIERRASRLERAQACTYDPKSQRWVERIERYLVGEKIGVMLYVDGKSMGIGGIARRSEARG